MLSTNCYRKQRFGLRKLSVGLASVVLGFTLYGVGVTKADTTQPTETTASVSNTHTTDNTATTLSSTANNELTYTDTFSFYGPDGNQINNNNGQPLTVTESGKPGEKIPTTALFNTIQELQTQHKNWYVQNLGLGTEFQDNNQHYNLYFAIRQTQSVQETIKIDQDGQQSTKTYPATMNAQYDYQHVLDSNVHDFSGWEAIDFNHQVDVPTGYHMEITGVTVEPIIGKSTYNNEYGNVAEEAAELQKELVDKIKSNDQQLPTYTLIMPANVTFNIKYIKDSAGEVPSDQPVHHDEQQPTKDLNNQTPISVEKDDNRHAVVQNQQGQSGQVINTNSHQNNKVLPQTGNHQDKAVVLSLLSASLLGILILSKKRDN